MSTRRISEDVLAIIMGCLLLLLALLVLLMPALVGMFDFTGIGNFLLKLVSESKPSAWQLNPFRAFRGSMLLYCALWFILLAGAFKLAVRLMDGQGGKFLAGFSLVFLLALAAYLLAAQGEFKSVGLGYALWAIFLGLLVSNTVGIPDFLRPALRHELYIKIGLVLLGAEVLFGKVLAIGLPGIFVAWIVTPIVLISTFWFGQRILKISSKTLNITISADMSVCGVSAAIATAAACRARKEELTTAIGLSMIFTSIMMVALPTFIRAMGMPEVLGGAWIGGTVDATGAVVAAGAFLGDTAMNVAATIKMIQNILIGVLAFAVALYWTTNVEKEQGTHVGASEIWLRFPKFVLGFISASIVFSLLHGGLGNEMATALLEDRVLEFSSTVRGWLFALAFASIGLSTNLKELRAQFTGGKPLILYICGQSLNLGLTLLMAWIMFYKVFPEITSAL